MWRNILFLITVIALTAYTSVAQAQSMSFTQPAQPDRSAQAKKAIDDAAARAQVMAEAAEKKLRAGLLISDAVYCVEKKSGKEKTLTFYQKTRQVIDQVKALCRAGQGSKAKSLVLAEFATVKNEPIIGHIQQCYKQYEVPLTAATKPDRRADLPKYYRWTFDAALAEREMTPRDLCN